MMRTSLLITVTVFYWTRRRFPMNSTKFNKDFVRFLRLFCGATWFVQTFGQIELELDLLT